MFQFSALGATVRTFAGAAAVAAVVAVAAPAAAAPIFVHQAGYFDTLAMGYDANTVKPDMYFISPLQLKAANTTGPSANYYDYLAFCIQLNVDMFNEPGGENPQMGPVVIDAQYGDNNTLLTGADRDAVARLVTYGTKVFNDNPGPYGTMDDFWAVSDPLAKVQVAIWQITNPTYDIQFGDYYPDPAGYAADVTALVAAAKDGSLGPKGDIRTIYGAGRQGLAIASAAVPEPMSWALMISGFGFAGAALRRRRALTAH